MVDQVTLEYLLSSCVQNSTADLYHKFSSWFDKIDTYYKKNYLPINMKNTKASANVPGKRTIQRDGPCWNFATTVCGT